MKSQKCAPHGTEPSEFLTSPLPSTELTSAEVSAVLLAVPESVPTVCELRVHIG